MATDTDAEPIPALLLALAALVETWAETLQLHGHRSTVRQRLENNMRETAVNLQTAATQADPEALNRAQ